MNAMVISSPPFQK
jgi:hypothetical protein